MKINKALINKALELPAFSYIQKAADALHIEAYVIGGFVRDTFLGRETGSDIDIVAVGSGIALAKKFAEFLPGKNQIQVFKNYGTAMIKFGDTQLEFVGARKESYTSDSRNPVVENGSLEDDQNRRDFTINALALCLNTAQFGALLDPFNGIADLEKGVLRTPLDPDITYSDDPLRMLRAIRFANQLDFEIEQKSFDSIIKNNKRVAILSKERIVEELHKILICKKPSTGFLLLEKNRAFSAYFYLK